MAASGRGAFAVDTRERTITTNRRPHTEDTMNMWLGALAVLLVAAGPAAAADEKKDTSTSTSQTQKMTECNAQAKDRHLSGDERRQVMSDCLKAHPAGAPAKHADKGPKTAQADTPHNAQGEKMKACNQEASGKNLHGDERKQF